MNVLKSEGIKNEGRVIDWSTVCDYPKTLESHTLSLYQAYEFEAPASQVAYKRSRRKSST